jgi:hypothetical protein
MSLFFAHRLIMDDSEHKKNRTAHSHSPAIVDYQIFTISTLTFRCSGSVSCLKNIDIYHG